MSTKEQKQKHIDYARELYCTLDSKGNRVFSFDDIVIKFTQKFRKKYTKSTFAKWSKKYDFANTLESIKKESIAKATNTENETIEKIIEKQSEILANDFKNADTLANAGYKLFFDYYNNVEHEYIDEKMAMQAIKLGIDIKHRIMSLPEIQDKETGQRIIVIDGVVTVQ